MNLFMVVFITTTKLHSFKNKNQFIRVCHYKKHLSPICYRVLSLFRML